MFNIGDKVKLIGVCYGVPKRLIGKEATIIKVGNYEDDYNSINYGIKINNSSWYINGKCLEKIKDKKGNYINYV